MRLTGFQGAHSCAFRPPEGVTELFDDQRVDRGAGTVYHLQRCSRVQERVLTVSGAVRCQCVKVYDLGKSDSEIPHQGIVERQSNPDSGSIVTSLAMVSVTKFGISIF